MGHFLSAFFHRLSNVFVLFGAALFLLGGAVQGTRFLREAADAGANHIPSFAASVHVVPTRVVDGGLAVALATPTPAPLPDRIVIPTIHVDSRVVEVGWAALVVNGELQGNVWQTASYAAGFLNGSAAPGTRGNLVISGHNNIEGAVFHDLHDVKPGQWIYVFAGGRPFAYVVDENFIIPEAKASPKQRLDNVKWISATPDERLTLISCYPPWSNTHRVIVLGRPIHDTHLWPPDAPPAP